MDLGDLPPALLPALTRRIAEAEDGVIGLIAFGSYARGEAAPTSDLDLQAVLDRVPRVGYRTWFVDGLHVSVAFTELDALSAIRATTPARWSLGFAVEMPAVWVDSTPAALAVLGDPPDFSRPPAPAELEDFVEWCAKALRAADGVQLRIAARGLAEEAIPLLCTVNRPVAVRDRFDAVRAATTLAIAPAGFGEDVLRLLGLDPAPDDRVRGAVERVGRGLLSLLRERNVVFEQPELTTYLADGTLERHLGFA
jgi:phosphoribosyl-AMP cyclohydrolase